MRRRRGVTLLLQLLLDLLLLGRVLVLELLELLLEPGIRRDKLATYFSFSACT